MPASLCLFDDVLDRRLVDDGEHLLGHRLGRRKEARSESGGGDDGLEWMVRHAPNPTDPHQVGVRPQTWRLESRPCPTRSPTPSAPCAPSCASDASCVRSASGMPRPPASAHSSTLSSTDSVRGRCRASCRPPPSRAPASSCRGPWNAASVSSFPSRAPTACSTGRSRRPTATSPRACSDCPSRSAKSLGPIAVNDVDLLVIPAAAVDRDGGCDSAGAAASSTRPSARWSAARPCTPSSSTPRSSTRCPSDIHDQPVTGVVTPTQTITLAPARR